MEETNVMRGPLVAVLCLLWAGASVAKPWNGIEPGQSKRDDVVKRFGEPTRTLTTEGKDMLAYLGKRAIKGTSQAQFRIDPQTQKVERIDVFPGPVIERDTVENSYGPACPTQGTGPDPCYVKKLTEDFRTYYTYASLGLAVFFNEDGKTVQSFTFQSPKGAAKP